MLQCPQLRMSYENHMHNVHSVHLTPSRRAILLRSMVSLIAFRFRYWPEFQHSASTSP